MSAVNNSARSMSFQHVYWTYGRLVGDLRRQRPPKIASKSTLGLISVTAPPTQVPLPPDLFVYKTTDSITGSADLHPKQSVGGSFLTVFPLRLRRRKETDFYSVRNLFEQDCFRFEGRPPANSIHILSFCCRDLDLDLDPMPLTYELTWLF